MDGGIATNSVVMPSTFLSGTRRQTIRRFVVPASTFNLLSILQFIASISGKIPQLMALVNSIIALFADEIEAAVPAGTLQVAELTPQESALVEQISQGLSASGTQAVLDLAKLMQLARWLNTVANTPWGKALIGLFGGIATGS